MLNKKKIQLMTKAARFEKSRTEELKISKFYRTDYLGLAMLRNFLSVTIGYLLLLLLIAVYHSEYLLDNIYVMNIEGLVKIVVIGYLLFLSIYSLITYAVYSIKFVKAKKKLEEYDRVLNIIERMDEKENGGSSV